MPSTHPFAGAVHDDAASAPDHSMQARARSGPRDLVAVAALAYLLFVVYGSLVPFAFTDRPMVEVLVAFLPPRWIPLAATDRADWIANALLYAPLAFLALCACEGRDGRHRAGRALVVIGSLALLAVAVEFAQGFFPPRTVSANDLVAEGAGVLLGALAWIVAGRPFLVLVGALRDEPTTARRALALAVVLGYLVLALFPFDFVVSLAELRARFDSPAVGPGLAPIACTRTLPCVGRLGVEAVAGIAFGIALHWLRVRPVSRASGRALAHALMWSAGIELAQLLEVSGVAQGASALARTAGITIGLRIAFGVPQAVLRLRDWPGLRPALYAAWVLYAAALVAATGLLTARPLSPSQAWARLAEVRLVPFYYHYYVSEQWALVSVAVYAALFAPVGVLVALGRLPQPPALVRGGRAAVLLAATLCLLVETGKLFAGRRPDPTDLLVAVIGSCVAYRLVLRFFVERPPAADPTAVVSGRAARALPVTFGPWTIVGAVLLLGVALALLRYPLPAYAVALALAVYGAALLRWPQCWLLVLPALLPVLDLAPWTGWLFLDEFDLVAMVSIAALSVVPRRPAPAGVPPRLGVVLVVLAALTLLALVRGLAPLDLLAPDLFWQLQHGINALRPARATLWAFLLLALVAHWSDGPAQDLLRLARGMTLGLLAAGIWVVWEHATFAGLTDFTGAYRAVGAFSAASTGGAQLESFVAAALPFAVAIAWRGPARWRLTALAAIVLGAHAIAATVSRTAVLGAVAALATFVLAAAVASASGRRKLALAAAGVAALAAAGGAMLVASGRLPGAAGDFSARIAHWHLLADVVQADAADAWLGAGLGAFPEVYYWNGPPSRRPALYSYRREAGTSYLHVAPGAATFLDQVVPATAAASYTVRARLRSAAPGATATFALCAKWTLYSIECHAVEMRTSRAGEWQALAAPVSAPAGRAGGMLEPTLRFSINGGAAKVPFDVADLALVDGSGRNILANATFAAAGTRWFLAADDPWAWNVGNAFIEAWLEQGWLGLAAFLWLALLAAASLAARVGRGEVLAAAAAGALTGFLAPALFDSVIDDPRMRWLALVLLTIPLLAARPLDAAGSPGRALAR